MHLTFVYVSAILNFVCAIRSATGQLLQRIFIDSLTLSLQTHVCILSPVCSLQSPVYVLH